MACIDLNTWFMNSRFFGGIYVNTCQYMALHNSWILGFLWVYMSIHAITCQYIPIHNSWILGFLWVYMSVHANTFCIRIHAPLFRWHSALYALYFFFEILPFRKCDFKKVAPFSNFHYSLIELWEFRKCLIF